MAHLRPPHAHINRIGIAGRELLVDKNGLFDVSTLATDHVAQLRGMGFKPETPPAAKADPSDETKAAEQAAMDKHGESLRLLGELDGKSDDELRAIYVSLRPDEAIPPDASHSELVGLVHAAKSVQEGSHFVDPVLERPHKPTTFRDITAVGEDDGSQGGGADPLNVNVNVRTGEPAGAAGGAAATPAAPAPATGAQDGPSAAPQGAVATPPPARRGRKQAGG